MNEPWFDPHGVLDPEKHARLIQQREMVARDANIPMDMLWKPLKGVVSSEEMDWVRKFHRHRDDGYCGLVLLGEQLKPSPLVRMSAIAGCLSRNFIRARVFSLLAAIETDKTDREATCLLIPDFVAGKQAKKEIAGWRLQQLTDLLTERWSTSGLQTVVYAPDLGAIKTEFGSYVGDLIAAHYVQVKL